MLVELLNLRVPKLFLKGNQLESSSEGAKSEGQRPKRLMLAARRSVNSSPNTSLNTNAHENEALKNKVEEQKEVLGPPGVGSWGLKLTGLVQAPLGSDEALEASASTLLT